MKINKINLACALVLLTGLLVFPWINPCENSTTLCTSKSDITVTDFYGLKIYLP